MRRFRFGWASLAVCLLVAACDVPSQDANTPAADPFAAASGARPLNGIGYVVFDAPVNGSSSAILIRAFDRLQATGADEIDLLLNSQGGLIDAAWRVVADMDRLHTQHGVVFKAWNIKLVASAATVIFLDAQHRYAYPNASFLFHGVKVVESGTFSADALREQATRIDQFDHDLRQALLVHTRLTPEQADTYISRTVILSADDALKDGVTNATGPLKAPPTAPTVLIKVAKKKAATGSSAEPHG